MGIEIVAALFLTQLLQFSELVYQNAGLFFFSFVFAIAWITGTFTIVRRWRSE
jgi:hypothetical protein